MKKVLFFTLAIAVACTLIGCQQSSSESPKNYTVTFDANGGSGTMAPQSIVSGTSAALSANAFTKPGYYFAGWAATDSSGVSFTDCASYAMGSASVTLYAVWTTNPAYTVTFDANGGSGTMAPQSIVGGTSAVLAANSFTYPGYTFAGWATIKDSTVSFTDGSSYAMGSANVTLYAVWTANPAYTVTFDANGGSGTMAAQSIVSGLTASLSSNLFTKTGCTFAGWSITTTETLDYTNNAPYTMGTANVTLRAVWDDGLAYTLINGSTEYSVAFGRYSKTALVIPEYYRGKKVTAIADSGFSNKGQLTSVILSSNIRSIGSLAFASCINLTGTLTIPSSVVSIGRYAFCDCTKLTGPLTIPSSVTSIGSYAFDNCSGLTGALTISSGVTSIEDAAFAECPGFNGALTIPSGVTSIGNDAFTGCSGFNGTLTLPSSVISIGYNAFSSFSGTVLINAVSPPVLPAATVFTVAKITAIKVPAASVSAYKAANYWSDYASIISAQ